jgi:MipA family protein
MHTKTALFPAFYGAYRPIGAALLALSCANIALAQSAYSDRLVGDVGAAVYTSSGVVRGGKDSAVLLPYVYADWGRFFARVDTFGLKLLPMGNGHLELAARVSLEGFKTDTVALPGIGQRGNPQPVGVGTYQETAWGGFFLNAFHDFRSHGSLLEATYAAEFRLGAWQLYPQFGIERRSSKYVQSLYGVTSAESAASGYPAYTAPASTTPMLGLGASVPLQGDWGLNMQWRRKWLDSAIKRSPLVHASTQDTAYLALTRSFK